MNKRDWLVALAISATLVGGTAAQDEPTPLPRIMEVNGIRYMSGGTGSDEAQRLREIAKDWSLTLEFGVQARPRDEYLADVKVSIADSSGATVLDATSDGPFMLVALPAGRYSISADSDGVVKKRSITVDSRHPARQFFEWGSQYDDRGPLGESDRG
jgi:hypothetical protein